MHPSPKPSAPQNCLNACYAGIKSLFVSDLPRPVDGKPHHLETGGLRFDERGPNKQLNLDESLASVDAEASPMSVGLLSVVTDINTLNKELVKAIDAADSDRVHLLLDKGANSNYIPENRPESVLLLACYNQDTRSVSHLLSAGANPNFSLNSITPLMVTAETGMTEAAAELLKYNADPHVRNSNGETALMAAARSNNHDVFAVLVGSMVRGSTPTLAPSNP